MVHILLAPGLFNYANMQIMLDWSHPISGIILQRLTGAPLYRQVADALEDIIIKGIMSVGERLPSERVASEMLKVDRSTVTAAYRLLKEKGLVESRVGSGVRVAESRASSPLVINAATERLIELMTRPSGSVAVPMIADFEYVVPNLDALPMKLIRSIMDDVLREEGDQLLQYGDSLGYSPLRKTLGERLGVPADRILITSGAQQALALAFGVLSESQRTIGIEAPTYSGAVQLVKYHGLRSVSVPVTDEGWDMTALEQRHTNLVYIQPCHQNPTGRTMGKDDLDRIFHLVRRHSLTVIEDGGDAIFWGGEPLFRRLPRNSTVHIGSLSKFILPGLRIGWLTGPLPFVSAVRMLKGATDVHTSHLLQAVLHRLLHFPELTDAIHKEMEHQMEIWKRARNLAKRLLPDSVRIVSGEGSSWMFLYLPEGMTASHVVQDLLNRGVRVSVGSYFFAHRPAPEAVRLALGAMDPKSMEKGFQILGEVLEDRSRQSLTQTAGLPPL